MNGISKETFKAATPDVQRAIMFDIQLDTLKTIKEITPIVTNNSTQIASLYRIMFYLLGASGVGGLLMYLGNK